MNKATSSALLSAFGTALLIWGLLGFGALHWGTAWVGHYDNGLSYDVVARALSAVGAALLVGSLMLRKDAR